MFESMQESRLSLTRTLEEAKRIFGDNVAQNSMVIITKVTEKTSDKALQSVIKQCENYGMPYLIYHTHYAGMLVTKDTLNAQNAKLFKLLKLLSPLILEETHMLEAQINATAIVLLKQNPEEKVFYKTSIVVAGSTMVCPT